jgi:hypothetical protein
MHKKINIVIVSISILIFLASLTQTAYCIDREADDCVSALMALLLGWLMPFGGGIAWFANPLLVVAWISIFKNVKRALVLSFVSLLFALYFLFSHTIVSDEAGHKYNIISRNAGYWLWVLSIASFGVCTGGVFLFGGRARSKSLQNRLE